MPEPQCQRDRQCPYPAFHNINPSELCNNRRDRHLPLGGHQLLMGQKPAKNGLLVYRLCVPGTFVVNALLFSVVLRNSVQRGASGVRKIHSVQKTGLCVYRRGIRCKKQPSGVRDAYSEALGAKNRLLVYRMEIRCRKQASGVPDAASKTRSSLLLLQMHLRKHGTAPATPDAFSKARRTIP